jgi:hypothetical protein
VMGLAREPITPGRIGGFALIVAGVALLHH